jgi:hypothetical protein
MIKKKSIILSFAMMLSSLGIGAATPGVTLLFTNGNKASFAFASKPVIAMNGNELTVTVADKSAANYQFADVQRFYFEDDVVETGVAKVEGAVATQHPVFGYNDGVVTVSGMAAGEHITVATVNGSLVKAAKADNAGNTSLDLTGEPTGIYVVSTTSGVSFKLLKK